MSSFQYTLSEEHVDYSKNPDKFIKFVIVFLIIMHPRKISIFLKVTSLSWLNHIEGLLYKEHVLEAKFWKILLKKTNYFIKNKKLLCFSSEKEKKWCFAKINEKDITDNRKFWQTIKPFLSDNIKSK